MEEADGLDPLPPRASAINLHDDRSSVTGVRVGICPHRERRTAKDNGSVLLQSLGPLADPARRIVVIWTKRLRFRKLRLTEEPRTNASEVEGSVHDEPILIGNQRRARAGSARAIDGIRGAKLAPLATNAAEILRVATHSLRGKRGNGVAAADEVFELELTRLLRLHFATDDLRNIGCATGCRRTTR